MAGADERRSKQDDDNDVVDDGLNKSNYSHRANASRNIIKVVTKSKRAIWSRTKRLAKGLREGWASYKLVIQAPKPAVSSLVCECA